MNTITPLELADRIKRGEKPRLLDVREPDEFAIASLPEATLVPLGDLPSRFDELDGWRGEDIVVYCHHGIRSAHAIAFLASQGFGRLYNLSGGIDRWSAEVDPKTPRY